MFRKNNYQIAMTADEIIEIIQTYRTNTDTLYIIVSKSNTYINYNNIQTKLIKKPQQDNVIFIFIQHIDNNGNNTNIGGGDDLLVWLFAIGLYNIGYLNVNVETRDKQKYYDSKDNINIKNLYSEMKNNKISSFIEVTSRFNYRNTNAEIIIEHLTKYMCMPDIDDINSKYIRKFKDEINKLELNKTVSPYSKILNKTLSRQGISTKDEKYNIGFSIAEYCNNDNMDTTEQEYFKNIVDEMEKQKLTNTRIPLEIRHNDFNNFIKFTERVKKNCRASLFEQIISYIKYLQNVMYYPCNSKTPLGKNICAL